jgi:hypothetical protein
MRWMGYQGAVKAVNGNWDESGRFSLLNNRQTRPGMVQRVVHGTPMFKNIREIHTFPVPYPGTNQL